MLKDFALMKFSLALILACLLMVPGGSVAQSPLDFSFSTYGVRDGLVDEDIRTVMQDSSGFIWFGARSGGLSRYDGYTHKTFQNDHADPASLPSDFVWTMMVDRSGTLWVGTNLGGLARFDAASETFVNYAAQPENPTALPHNDITALLEDSQGRFWVGTHGGLTLFDAATGTFERIMPDAADPNTPAGKSARAILEDRSTGDIWFGFRRNGISILDAQTGRFRHLRHDPARDDSLNSDAVNRLFQDRNGEIWVGTRNGLARFDRSTQSFKRYLHDPENPNSLAGHRVTGLSQDPRGRLWIATRTGLSLFRPNTQDFANVSTNTAFGSGGTATEYNHIFQDSAGGLWFGTVGQGAAYLSALPERFYMDQSDLFGIDDGVVARRNISALLVDARDGVWKGLGGIGLSYRSADGQIAITPAKFQDMGLPSATVTALSQDNDGNIWIGQLGALSRFDGTDLQVFPLEQESAEIKSIAADQNGGVWIGVHDFGVLFFENGIFRAFPHDPDDPASFPSFYPEDILADPEGSGAWIGTSAVGLAHINLENAKIRHRDLTPDNTDAVVSSSVTSIARGRDGFLWLGTSDGVMVFDPVADRFVGMLTLADGLPSSSISSLSFDTLGDLWVATARGLVRWRPATETVQSFDVRDDLFSAGFVQRAVSQDSKGRVYWGTTGGVLSSDPGAPSEAASAASLVLTELKIDDALVMASDETQAISVPIHEASEIRILPQYSSFSLGFSALDFRKFARPFYAFRLDGLDRDWTTPSADTRNARYVGVPPGTYDFYVRAGTADGQSTAPVRQLSIVVLPQWWQTIWFRSGVIVVLLGLATAGILIQRRVTSRFEDLAKFADENPNPVLRFDSQNALSYANPSSAALAKTGLTTLGTQAPEPWREKIQNVRQGATADMLQRWEDEHSGRTYDLTFSPVQSSTSINVFASDTTDRDLSEKKLRQSQKMEAIGQLTGGIAHDFNNLLAIVLGNLELAEETGVSDNLKPLISAAKDATMRGGELTRNMLSFARQASLTPDEIDLNSVVKDINTWAARVLPETIEVDTSLLAGLWKVVADPTSTQNAFLNLVINARDAMPEGGKITVETSNMRIGDDYIEERLEDLEPGRYVMLAVSDTGTGIPPEDLEQIFDPFFSTKETGKGSGLGLSMVMGFMKQSGGTVRVYSEKGEGTSFKLFFPASTAAPNIAARIAKDQVITPTPGARILLVEDEQGVMDVLTEVLTSAGYNITTARSGDEAYEIFTRLGTVDLVVTDIVMPGQLQGPTLVKKLRSLQPELPAIFMSGYANEATVHGNGLRPEDVRLMKPIPRKDLIAAIEACIEGAAPVDVV